MLILRALRCDDDAALLLDTLHRSWSYQAVSLLSDGVTVIEEIAMDGVFLRCLFRGGLDLLESRVVEVEGVEEEEEGAGRLAGI